MERMMITKKSSRNIVPSDSRQLVFALDDDGEHLKFLLSLLKQVRSSSYIEVFDSDPVYDYKLDSDGKTKSWRVRYWKTRSAIDLLSVNTATNLGDDVILINGINCDTNGFKIRANFDDFVQILKKVK